MDKILAFKAITKDPPCVKAKKSRLLRLLNAWGSQYYALGAVKDTEEDAAGRAREAALEARQRRQTRALLHRYFAMNFGQSSADAG
ncbi:MAG: hypothetical protein NTY45_10340 [Elusimicrobia bacterium]|nr:hypothetical protein [Elusimicrobiota bacterium]